MNLPDYQFLPAPLWLITTLHLVTLTLHLVAMNLLAGGVVVLLLARLPGRWQNDVARSYVKLLPSLMAATVTFGVAPLLFVQLVYPIQVYSASITSAWLWLCVPAAVIIAYYFLYGAAAGVDRGPGRTGLYLGVALLGFLYVSFVYSSVFSLAETPDRYRELYAGNQSGLVLNPHVGDYLVRWLHMLLGAVTVGSFLVGALARGHEETFAVVRRFFLVSLVVTMLAGLIYLFTLGDTIQPFMRSPGIYALTVAVVLSLGALHFFWQRKLVLSGLLLFLSMLGMVIARHVLRLLLLEGAYDPGTYPIAPQWDTFALFLVCFLLAIGVIAYMLRLFFAGRPETA